MTLDQERKRLIFAAMLVIAAFAAILISYHWSATLRSVTRNVIPLPERFQPNSDLTNVIDTYPTSETIGTVANQVRSSVRKQTRDLRKYGLSEVQLEDLVQVTQERIMAVLAPDFDRDYLALQNRGFLIDRTTAKQHFQSSKSWYESLSLSPIGVKGIYVRLVRGSDRTVSDTLRGFGKLVGRVKHTGALFADQSPMVVVEVLMPITANTIPGRSRDSNETAILGLKFGWSSHRNQWIPSEICTYYKLTEGRSANVVVTVPSTL